jgi:hypothetical protein
MEQEKLKSQNHQTTTKKYNVKENMTLEEYITKYIELMDIWTSGNEVPVRTKTLEENFKKDYENNVPLRDSIIAQLYGS